MENGGATMVYQRTFKPQGKMRRRIKDLRISSFSYLDTCRARPDLSHNESVRLAVDSMLTRGLEAYHKMLTAEGEVDFLSEPEKTYMLQNGTDGCAGSAPDASDDQFERLSVFSEAELTYKMTSAETELTLTPNRENGATSTNQVQDEPTVQIYFPSDIRPAGIKDVVRNFIREAKMALAIVMEFFSDVELLCDVLVACKKRNVAVHLLLDRSNLDLFVDMWRGLQLDGKNFPVTQGCSTRLELNKHGPVQELVKRFSVRSVVGHTYCARTGRRLTGQMTESFVIRDWTEALTGTYSFSWLSGQVHRCHAVLVKGSTVLPFHQEFHRLNSSSTPVPGFATYESVPRTLPLNIYNSVHASQKDQNKDFEAKPTWTEDTQTADSQTRAKPESLAELQSSVSERTGDKDNTQHPQVDLEPLLHAEEVLRASVGQAEDTTDSSTTTDAKTLEKISNHDSGSSDLLSDSLQSELSSLTISCIADQVPESNLQQTAPLLSRRHRPPCLKTYLKPEAVNGRGAEGPGVRQRQRDGLFKALGTAVRPSVQRRDWSCPPNFKPRVHLQPMCSQALSPSLPVKKDRNAGFLSFFTHAKEHILNHHKGPRHRPRAQDQPDRHRQQSRFQPHRSAESLVSAPALSTMSGQYQPRCLLLSDIKAKRNAQLRPAARHGSVRSAYEAGQQASWRPGVTPLRRSLSSNDQRCFLHRVQEDN